MITPSLAELFTQFLEQRLKQVPTAVVGQIQRYENGKADIVVEGLPLLLDVPVIYAVLTYPIEVGDSVQVVFNHRSWSEPVAFLMQQKADGTVALAEKVLQELKSIVQAFNRHTHAGPIGPVSQPIGLPQRVGATR